MSQPRALQLANWLQHRSMGGITPKDIEASEELRSQHAEIERLNQLLMQRAQDAWQEIECPVCGADGARAALPPLVQCEPVYQYQLANGQWIDQEKDSYDYGVRYGQAVVRILYTYPKPERVALTDEQIKLGRQSIRKDIEDQPEGWSFKEGVRFAERHHKIGENHVE